MRILVIGSGGREHALCWKLSQEAEVHCSPGNPGIASDCEVHDVAVSDSPGLADLAKRIEADLVVIGPENPLIDGLADALRAKGVATFGPGADAARLEGSKAFSKKLMREAGVATAAFETFTDARPAMSFAAEMFASGRPVVVKASGAALGKGVVVCDAAVQAEAAISQMLEGRELGEAGATVVIEERLNGPEFSLLTLCSDGEILSLPVAQDYKRAHDGDQGPNTGGMGSYSPVPWVNADMVRETEETVVRPALTALARQGIGYRGVLFSGLMLHDGKPHCLEYNVRFGDPETQSVAMRLGTGFAEALLACANGESIPQVEILDNAAVTVVIASEGYPGSYEKGLPISVTDESSVPTTKLFHAGTSLNRELVTTGGRVFGASCAANSLKAAREGAYQLARSVEFEGAWHRSDIGR